MGLDYLFPTIPNGGNNRPYKTNDIIHRNCVVFSAQGQGKSEFCRALAEKYVEKYGKNNVAALLSRLFPRLIKSVGAVKDRPVQLFIWEDASLKKQRDEELAAFFNVRHIYQARTGENKAVLITINNTHDLFAIKKKLRSSVDAIFFRGLPTDDYDIRIAKSYLGEDNFKKFSEIIKQRDADPKLKGITYYNIRGEVGFVDWSLANENYVMDLDPVGELGLYGTNNQGLNQLKIRYITALMGCAVYLIIFGWMIARFLFHL